MTPVMTPVEVQEQLSVRSLIATRDLTRGDIELIFSLAARAKNAPAAYSSALRGKQLAMLFEKPSLRTRVTFEVAMTSMGGFAVYLDHAKPRLGERESVKDIARNLDRWVDGIVARTFAHESVVELAANASIPVVNGLTDLLHPCQALTDLFTLEERFGSLAGVKLAYVGDGNNVCHSLMTVAAKLGVCLHIATPAGFAPKPQIVDEAGRFAARSGAAIELFQNPVEAVKGCDAVYTDVWAGMGQEYAAHLREQVFAPFQVNDALMAAAGRGALFMHCLPAHRGKEVTDSVIDSPRSIVYDQAENRLHVQKAILMLLLGR
ncbi:MAG: ornithine carbamoyltransferase [Terriglobia bacterium]